MNQRQFDALDHYFGALLEEESPQPRPQPAVAEPAATTVFAEPEEAARRQGLEALLARVAELKDKEEEPLPPPVLEAEPEPAPVMPPEPMAAPVVDEPAPAAPTPPVAAEEAAAAWRNMDTGSSFQALFFEVAGMTFAVPLTHLGGIYQVSRLTSLFGKPDWFAGVMTERQRQLYVVDTARWAMPGHLAKEEYQYLVTLGESNWGLGCHRLKGTALLSRDQVKWRAIPGSRPWLAGMVKEKMCALLHVDALIGLLEQGKNIDGQQV